MRRLLFVSGAIVALAGCSGAVQEGAAEGKTRAQVVEEETNKVAGVGFGMALTALLIKAGVLAL